MLDQLPSPSPSPAKIRRKRQPKPKTTSYEDWQSNYINEYSKLFISYEALKKENFEQKGTIETLQIMLKSAENEYNRLADASKNTSDAELVEIKRENIELKETIEALQIKLKSAENEYNRFADVPENAYDVTTDSGYDQTDTNSSGSQLLDQGFSDSGTNLFDDESEIKVVSASKYICDCGYDAGELKNRLITHQKQFCKVHEPSVPDNLRCPICGIQNTYLGIKSHLAQFARAGRENKTRDARHQITNVDHLDALAAFKKKYGPKKSRKTGKTTKSKKKKSKNSLHITQ